jgi:hypothetical protein
MAMKRSGMFGALLLVVVAAPAAAQAPAVVTPPPPAPSIPVTPPPPEPTPPCTVTVTDGDSHQGLSFFIGGDYLYVKPRRRLQDYVIVDPFNDGRVAGTIESVDWGWRSAFRIGGGVQLAYGLEVAFYYTYLHDASQAAAFAPDGGTLFATLTHPGTVDQVTSAFAATSFNYNLFDLEVSKTFRLADCFGVRVFGGSRSARIDQNLNALYDGNTANKDFVASQVRFNGGGARLGLEGIWHPGDGWGLYARGAASLVLGDFKSHLSEVNNAGTTVLVDITERFDKVLPVLELGFGVSYQYRGWRVTAGYEYTNWFGLADLPDFVDDFHQGKFVHRVSDISIDGLVVRVEYRY